MATPVWSPSTLYVPGSLVQPLTAVTPQAVPPDNPNFASGNVGWDLDANLAIVAEQGYGSPNSLRLNPGSLGPRDAINQYQAAVIPGQSITASCSIQQGASAVGNAGGLVKLMWYDSGDILISESVGNNVNSGSGGAWNTSTVTGSAPSGAAYARVAIGLYRNAENFPVWAANVTWNYVLQAASGLIYKAVQPLAGFSAATEPVWPPVNGQTVVDNEVIWEAVLITRIVWEAQPILVSGPTEPTWPTMDGQTTPDNTISWETVSRRVEDPKCPNSRIVIIASSKIFAADGDIVPYSATVNPLDWSSPDDAGYLPTNLQQYGANPVGGLGLYRGNLHVMNSQGSQAWQVDEDPAQMALLDAFPIGTTYHESISPAFNDLFILTELGVRSTGIAGGSTNLQAGDVGMPIDPLVQQALSVAKANSVTPMGLYNPNAGQYWLMFPQFPPSPVAIHGDLTFAALNVPLPAFTYTGTGGIQPYTFQLINGAVMPPGLTLSTNGTVSGTPTQQGTFSWDVQITDAQGLTDWQTDTVQVVIGPMITGDAPDGVSGTSYAGYTYTLTPGSAPIDHTEIIAGQFPTGLTFDEATAAILAGTPTVPGTYNFTLRTIDTNQLYDDLDDTVNVLKSMILIGRSGVNDVVIRSNGETGWNSAPIYTGTGNRRYGIGIPGGRYAMHNLQGATPAAYTDDKGASWTLTAGNVISGGRDAIWLDGVLVIPGTAAVNRVLRSIDSGVTYVAVSGTPIRFLTTFNPGGPNGAGVSSAQLALTTNSGATFVDVGAHGISFTNGGGLSHNASQYIIFGNTGVSTPALTSWSPGSGFVPAILPGTIGAGPIVAYGWNEDDTEIAVSDANQVIRQVAGSGWVHTAKTFTHPAIQIKWTGTVFQVLTTPTGGGAGEMWFSPDGLAWTQAPLFGSYALSWLAQEYG